MNTYKIADAEVDKRLRSLRKKHHPMLDKARVRLEAFFVTTDGEDGASLRYKGSPTSCKTEILSQVNRVGSKADARILIDKIDWDNATAPQRDAMLDRALTFLKVKQKEETIVLDGNDRPKLELRVPDRVFAWFDVVAARHGEASLEVQEAKQVIDNATTYLPGFDFLARGEKSGKSNVVKMPSQNKSEPQAAAAAK